MWGRATFNRAIFSAEFLGQLSTSGKFRQGLILIGQIVTTKVCYYGNHVTMVTKVTSTAITIRRYLKCNLTLYPQLFAATAFIYPIQRIMRPVYAKTHFLCVFTPKVGIGNIKTARYTPTVGSKVHNLSIDLRCDSYCLCSFTQRCITLRYIQHSRLESTYSRFVLYGLTMVYRAMILLILLVCYFLIFLKMYLKTRNRE